MWESDWTRMGDCQTFILYNPDQLIDVELHAQHHAKQLVKVNLVDVGEDMALAKLSIAKTAGNWILFFNDHEQCTYDFLRSVAREVILPNRTQMHSEFRVWLLTTQPLESLPALIIQHCIPAPTIEPTVEFSSLASRDLVVAAETGYLYDVRANLSLIYEMTPEEQVELFRRALNEEVCLALLEGDPTFLLTARDAKNRTVLDVVIVRRYFLMVAEVIRCGGQSETLDFDEMLRPENSRLLPLLLVNNGRAFDTKLAVWKTALQGNLPVMKSLFDARVDVGFGRMDYPLVQCISKGDQGMTQLLLDRMDAVGLPPLCDSDIALHFLLELLQLPNDDDFSSFVLEMGSRLATAVFGVHPIPWQAVSHLVQAAPESPLVTQVLGIVDPTDSPGQYFDFFLRYMPHHPMTSQCLHQYLQEITQAQDHVEMRKQQVLRKIIHFGPKALPLAQIVLDDKVSPNFRLEIPQPDGAHPWERTPVMQCLELPGYPEALELLLSHPKVDVNVGNEWGLTALQQAVVDIINSPLNYTQHQQVYGDMFHDLIISGADAQVSQPAFCDTLFAYVARLEFAYLCIPLLPCTPGCNVVLHTSGNLLATMVNLCMDRMDKGLVGIDGVLDIRFAIPTPRDKWMMWLSLLRLRLSVYLHILSFGTAHDLLVWSLVHLRSHFLSLKDELWQCLADAEGLQLPDLGPLASTKLRYIAALTQETPHLYFKSTDGHMVCAYTGEVLKKGICPATLKLTSGSQHIWNTERAIPGQ